jgi:hypothetical protein
VGRSLDFQSLIAAASLRSGLFRMVGACSACAACPAQQQAHGEGDADIRRPVYWQWKLTTPKHVVASQCDSTSVNDDANQLPCWKEVRLFDLSGSGLSMPALDPVLLRRIPAGSTDRDRGLSTGPAQPPLYIAGTRKTLGDFRPAPRPAHRASNSMIAALSPLGFAFHAMATAHASAPLSPRCSLRKRPALSYPVPCALTVPSSSSLPATLRVPPW